MTFKKQTKDWFGFWGFVLFWFGFFFINSTTIYSKFCWIVSHNCEIKTNSKYIIPFFQDGKTESQDKLHDITE